jgi:hypothetical protein
LIGALEHLSKEAGLRLLEKAEGWARRKVIVLTPNGFLPQGSLSENPFEVHRSGWNVSELKARGYRPYGIGGLKRIRSENTGEGYGVSGNAIFSTIRLKPQWLWVGISAVSQLVTYCIPQIAFEVFYVKDCS